MTKHYFFLFCFLVLLTSCSEKNPNHTKCDSSATFTGKDKSISVCGYLDRRSPKRLATALKENPNADLLVMQYVPGGFDGIQPVFEMAKIIKANNMKVIVPSDGVIASFGTTAFVAGTRRQVAKGGKVGVHAWTDRYHSVDPTSGEFDGARSVLEQYYTSMGLPEDFYWFTVKAAPFDGMHFMTRKELEQYNIITE